MRHGATRSTQEFEFSKVLAEAKRGDPHALARIHRRFAPQVLSRVRDRLGLFLRRCYDSMDLSQSVFVDVLHDLGRFEDRGETAFRHWLCIKAENKVRDKLRRHLDKNGNQRESLSERSQLLARAGGSPATVDWVAGREQARVLLESLPPFDRRLLELRGQLGLPFSEIARQLRLSSADAARVRYARLLLALRNRWTGR